MHIHAVFRRKMQPQFECACCCKDSTCNTQKRYSHRGYIYTTLMCNLNDHTHKNTLYIVPSKIWLVLKCNTSKMFSLNHFLRFTVSPSRSFNTKQSWNKELLSNNNNNNNINNNNIIIIIIIINSLVGAVISIFPNQFKAPQDSKLWSLLPTGKPRPYNHWHFLYISTRILH